MTTTKMKAGLSRERIRLIEIMQQINFGNIYNFTVRSGEPCFEPPIRIVRKIKLGGENGPRPELGIDDFTLKIQLVELFRYLDELGNGTIESIEVKHGLPFRMKIQDSA